MSWFGRTITRQRYGIGLITRIAILMALTAGFPYLVYFVASSAGRGTSGAGGAIALVMGMYLKPLIYVAFALSLIRPAARRARTLEMTILVGPLIGFVVLADLAFGTLFFNHWSVAFSLGFVGPMRMPIPWLLLAALISLITLAVLAQRDDGLSARERFGIAYPIWLSLVALAALHGFVLITTFLSLGMGIAPRRLVALVWLTNSLPRMPLAIALMAASLWLIVADRLSGGRGSRAADTPTPTRPPGAPGPRGAPRAAFGLRGA
ncbi:hypothetical protein [Phreatobacter cathodiphilus]|uniref:Uncharacterized protein n=1 Tax=Phreatobacter cathodiphilus TaxID=1868589 RepID=A0A2S0NGT3_9HYPH|nr:hypothetical protein [Phreatobacter cathodiphilus]AVO47365.1 hypothetical protein C6569_21255 [Phreatobacter cathodiphilus]